MGKFELRQSYGPTEVNFIANWAVTVRVVTFTVLFQLLFDKISIERKWLTQKCKIIKI